MRCDDCIFANWEFSLFRDGLPRLFMGHVQEPYSEQFDLYCRKHERFYLEAELTGDCSDGEPGENNYHEVCLRFYREAAEYKAELKRKRKTDNDTD